MKIVYKCKQTGEVSSTVNLDEFSGYKIQIEHNKISKITELLNNEVLALINYRPTKTTLIHKIEYNGHVEYRYNNNKVDSMYFEFNNKRYGEYKKFNPSGELVDRKYYYDNRDITEEVMRFIDYKDDPNDFKYYTFQEDEVFNLMMKYGFYFRFCFESERESSEFDLITEYCQIN